jgi:ferrochelatase
VSSPAVLLMAHGSPDSPDQMGDYLRHIFQPRPVTDAMIAAFRERYAVFGGRSPLLDICRRQAAALQARLGLPVRVGMRHWRPFIADAVRDLGDPIVGLPLAPQYSVWSTKKYIDALRAAAATSARVIAIERWYRQPKFLDVWTERIQDGIRCHAPDALLFTAHSIPAKDKDPYEGELRETVDLLVARLPSIRWAFAWQSASPGAKEWLGPDVDQVVGSLGAKRVLAAPIGFVCDHAEVLYDIDHFHRQNAAKTGISLERCEMPNDHALLVEALADAVREVL